MNPEPNLSGQTKEMSGEAVFRYLATAVGEGWSAAAEAAGVPDDRNVFGRPVHFRATDSLGYAEGLLLNGLRASVWCKRGESGDHFKALSRMVRLHLPLVVGWVRETTGVLPAAGSLGCFHLVASNQQEVVDLTLIAWRIAELALIPGVVLMDRATAFEPGPVRLPSEEFLSGFSGSPDDWIFCPTPAQRMLFGKQRRRIPNWFSLDVPASLGMKKEGFLFSLESAARERFFFRHLPGLVEQVFQEYRQQTGRPVSLLSSYQAENADYIVLTYGNAFSPAREAVDVLRKQQKIRAGCLSLSCLNPIPVEELKKWLAGKKGIAVLEPLEGFSAGTFSLLQKIQTLSMETGGRKPDWFSGRFVSGAGQEELLSAFHHMLKKGNKQPDFLLGAGYTRQGPASPPYEVLLQAIQREYPGIEEESSAGPPPDKLSAAVERKEMGLPLAIRRYKDLGPPYSRLSRFYHDTVSLIQSGKAGHLVASPFQALPLAPAGSAGLADHSRGRTAFPVFKPEKCTACGQCLVSCPQMAMPSVTVNLEKLIRGGMDAGAARGELLTSLTPLVKPLSRVAGRRIHDAGIAGGKVAEFLEDALEPITIQMKLEGEKRIQVQQDFEKLLELLGGFPVAVTDPLFHQPETRQKGAGELFSIAVDPHACTGCGWCAGLCPEEALEMTEPDPSLMIRAETAFRFWERLSDTPGDTISRLRQTKDYDPFAALLLSRNFYLSLAGGPEQEPPFSASTWLHRLTALMEAEMQPRMARWSEAIRKQIDDLSERIHENLSDALPHDNYSALSRAMEELHAEAIPLDELIHQMGQAEHLKKLDATLLQRKIVLLQDLKQLHWALTEGPTGVGRARFGIMADDQAIPGGGLYPYNPFHTPAILHGKDGVPEKAAGLWQGMLRHLLDNLKLLRRAQLESQNQYDPNKQDEVIARLAWEDLNEQEKELVPPLLMILEETHFGVCGQNEWDKLLACPWPVKLVLLDRKLPGKGKESVFFSAGLLTALRKQQLFVLQGPLARTRELFEGLREGIRHPGPALFYLFAPEQDLPEGLRIQELALPTRAFPIFVHHPAKGNGSFSSSLSLDGNPDHLDDWHLVELEYQENGEKKSKPYRLTYADWLFTLPFWKGEFQLVENQKSGSLSVSEFLDLDDHSRPGKSPVIHSVDEQGVLRTWAASSNVIRATGEALGNWNRLREIAGERTAFPEKLSQKLEKEIREEYEEKIAQLKEQYEAIKKVQEQEWMENTRKKLSEKLLALSGRRTKEQ